MHSSISSWDCACSLIIHDYDTVRGDDAFRYFERRRDGAVGEQPLPTAQRYRVDHQPERIDQVVLDQCLNEVAATPNVQVGSWLLLDLGDLFCNIPT